MDVLVLGLFRDFVGGLAASLAAMLVGAHLLGLSAAGWGSPVANLGTIVGTVAFLGLRYRRYRRR